MATDLTLLETMDCIKEFIGFSCNDNIFLLPSNGNNKNCYQPKLTESVLDDITYLQNILPDYNKNRRNSTTFSRQSHTGLSTSNSSINTMHQPFITKDNVSSNTFIPFNMKYNTSSHHRNENIMNDHIHHRKLDGAPSVNPIHPPHFLQKLAALSPPGSAYDSNTIGLHVDLDQSPIFIQAPQNPYTPFALKEDSRFQKDNRMAKSFSTSYLENIKPVSKIGGFTGKFNKFGSTQDLNSKISPTLSPKSTNITSPPKNLPNSKNYETILSAAKFQEHFVPEKPLPKFNKGKKYSFELDSNALVSKFLNKTAELNSEIQPALISNFSPEPIKSVEYDEDAIYDGLEIDNSYLLRQNTIQCQSYKNSRPVSYTRENSIIPITMPTVDAVLSRHIPNIDELQELEAPVDHNAHFSYNEPYQTKLMAAPHLYPKNVDVNNIKIDDVMRFPFAKNFLQNMSAARKHAFANVLHLEAQPMTPKGVVVKGSTGDSIADDVLLKHHRLALAGRMNFFNDPNKLKNYENAPRDKLLIKPAVLPGTFRHNTLLPNSFLPLPVIQSPPPNNRGSFLSSAPLVEIKHLLNPSNFSVNTTSADIADNSSIALARNSSINNINAADNDKPEWTTLMKKEVALQIERDTFKIQFEIRSSTPNNKISKGASIKLGRHETFFKNDKILYIKASPITKNEAGVSIFNGEPYELTLSRIHVELLATPAGMIYFDSGNATELFAELVQKLTIITIDNKNELVLSNDITIDF